MMRLPALADQLGVPHAGGGGSRLYPLQGACPLKASQRSERARRRRRRSHLLLSTFERTGANRARIAAQARSGFAALCVVVHLRVARGSPRALHAVHAAAAFNIWQVATPSRSREGCACDRASLPRVRHSHPTSLFSRSSRRTSSCSHAHGGAGRRWFFLVQKWQRLAPTTQHTISR